MAKIRPNVNHVIIAVAKQLVVKKTNGEFKHRPLQEAMIDLHQTWYQMEKDWRKFLKAVKDKKPKQIFNDLINAIAGIMIVAAELQEGPVMYEDCLFEDTLLELTRNKNCPRCASPGHIISVIPQVTRPNWKFQCSECDFCWFSNADFRKGSAEKLSEVLQEDEDD